MKSKGFTFIELLVSVTIIAVLMAIATASYVSTNIRSRDTRRAADIQAIRSGLELYRSEVGNYPLLDGDGDGCLIETSISNAGVTYLSPVPTDPKNNATYCYKYTRGASPFTTYTITCSLESGDPCSYANP